MFSSIIIKAVLDELQNYLQTEIGLPLLLYPYTIGGVTFQKCYFFRPDLDFDPHLLKRVGKSSQEEFFAILYNRSSIDVDNYRRFDIRVYSKDMIQALVNAGELPEDYKGKARLGKVSLLIKPHSSIYEHILLFEEYFTLDWIGHRRLDTVVNLNNEISFDFQVSIFCQPWQEVTEYSPIKKLFTGIFEIEIEFPLVKLNPKSKLIREISHALYV